MKTDHRGYVLSGDTLACMKCGKQTDINLLDAKPPYDTKPEDREGADFTVLECEDCYGPNWLPMSIVELSK